MKVSVIVPVHNVEEYISQCLDSIIRQTYKNLEIIVVDDGSTDASSIICHEFAIKDLRINLIRQNNCGVSVARNRGIQLATGQYVTFVDADDWIEQDMYEKMVAELSTVKSDMMMCDSSLIYNDFAHASTEAIRQGIYTKKQVVKEIYPSLLAMEDFSRIPIVSVCNCLIKREVLIDNFISFEPNLKYSEDYLFMAEVITKITSFYYLKNFHLYNYRQRGESRSKKFQTDWWSNLIFLNKKLKQVLSNCEEFNFDRQLKLQLIHSALFVTKAIANHERFSNEFKLRKLQLLFNDDMLQDALYNLKFNNHRAPLKIALYLMKQRKAFLFLFYWRLLENIRNL